MKSINHAAADGWGTSMCVQGSKRRIDHDLDHLHPNLPFGYVVQDLPCVVQIQRRNYVLGHADYVAHTRQHEADHTYQEYICPTG